jgi:hypothetical protein
MATASAAPARSDSASPPPPGRTPDDDAADARADAPAVPIEPPGPDGTDPARPATARRRTPSWILGAIAIGAIAIAVVALASRVIATGALTLGTLDVAAGLGLAGAVVLLLGGLRYGEGYLAGLWLVSPLLPGVIAGVTVVSYLLAPAGTIASGALAVALGVAATSLAMGCAGFVGRTLASRERAQLRTYDQLRDRHAQLAARLEQLRGAPVEADRAHVHAAALAEAESRLDAAGHDLYDPEAGEPALRWALATGYSSLMRTLHRVEEIIVANQPTAAVVGDALHDTLSLRDSTIGGREDLGIHLASAMRVVSTKAAATFFTPRAGPAASVDVAALPSEAEAREVIREVRYAVNDFRDDRVAGLIGARNRLVWTMLSVGVATYLLLGLALLLGVPQAALGAAAVFYLVAAIVGMFNRLRIESQRGSAVEDYGLSMARLITGPLVSGLAGVAGVYLVAKTPQFFGSLFGEGAPAPLPLANIFDLAQNELGLLVAAVFGFAPSQLASALQRQADRFEKDLERSEPSGGSNLGAEG